MRYKVGDKIKIKTWEEMEKEYGITKYRCINCIYPFSSNMEEILEELNTNRIVTIKKINKYNNSYYYMKELGYCWRDNMIKYLVQEYKEPEPIASRFEILDIR